MSIIQQTMIKNCLTQDRRFRWAGKAGLHIKGGETVIVEGAYPTACKSSQCVKELEAAIAQGVVELTLVTDMAVARPVGKPGAVPIPAAIIAANIKSTQANTKAIIPMPGGQREQTKGTTTPAVAPNEQAGRWTTLTETTTKESLLPGSVTLRGHEDTEIAKPVTVDIFKDGAYDIASQEKAKQAALAAAEAADQARMFKSAQQSIAELTPAATEVVETEVAEMEVVDLVDLSIPEADTEAVPTRRRRRKSNAE